MSHPAKPTLRSATFRLVLAAALLAGCGGDETPADVAGIYTLNVTNGANECQVQNWMQGQQSMGAVTLTLTQLEDRSQVSGTVGGSAGFVEALFRLLYGSNNFSGTVTGKNLALEIVGGGPTEMTGACSHSRHARVVATVDRDTITGTLYHYFKSNKVPDCGFRNECNNTQNFNGTRPPK